MDSGGVREVVIANPFRENSVKDGRVQLSKLTEIFEVVESSKSGLFRMNVVKHIGNN